MSRRTRIVWGVFVVAMTVVGGLLGLSSQNLQTGFPAMSIDNMPLSSAETASIFRIDADLDRERWQGIVIHHSGSPGDDPEQIHRRHLGFGYQGLGYHFVIGNGNGMSDGLIHVGYRWNEQLPGAHVSGAAGREHNDHSIAICLVGNGDRRGFTDRQINELVRLVRRLQREFDIPAERVFLHRDVADGSTVTLGPGRFFPTSRFEEQLIR